VPLTITLAPINGSFKAPSKTTPEKVYWVKRKGLKHKKNKKERLNFIIILGVFFILKNKFSANGWMERKNYINLLQNNFSIN